MRKLGFITILLTLFISACTTTLDFKISFDSNGGSLVTPITTDGVSSITTPKDPVKEGYTFAGWYWDNVTFRELFTVNSLLDRGITNDLTVYAKWSVDETYVPIGSVKVIFDTVGGTSVPPTFVLPGRTILIPSTTKEGYTLDGWYTSVNDGVTLDERWSFTNNSVNNDITLYAKWNINTYTITFDTMLGSTIAPRSFNYNETIMMPAQPIRTGYTFTDWDQEILSKMPAENITLKALWEINQYTITFDSRGGDQVESITQDFNSDVAQPSNPMRVGYTFEGWFTNTSFNTRYTFNAIEPENIVLVAKWSVIQYAIAYQLDDGVNHPSNLSLYNVTSYITLREPTRMGYTFEGWFSDEDMTKVITSINEGSTGYITLHAKWQINTYTIEYKEYSRYDAIANITLNIGETIMAISLSNSNHSYAITSNNRVFAWGGNTADVIDGIVIDPRIPIEITTLFNLTNSETISFTSSNNSKFLTSTGRVFRLSTLSRNPFEITSIFSLVGGEIITSIVKSENHFLAITSSGRLLTWGRNDHGQLGDGSTTRRNTPKDITDSFNLMTGEKITSIRSGNQNSSALTSTGRIFMWGWNNSGQLGDGTTTDRPTPIDITSRFSLANGEIIKSIELGSSHSSALTTTGRVFMWGFNISGRLGDGTFTHRNTPTEITSRFSLSLGETVVSVSLGGAHSSALTSTGRVFMWGINTEGQLGDGTKINRNTPTQITSRFSLSSDETIKSISLSSRYSAALTSTGRLFEWGYNWDGTLLNDTSSTLPVEITSRFYKLLSSKFVTHHFQTVLTPLIEPVLEGFAFDGWYIDSTFTKKYRFTTMPAENIVLYGRWIEVVNEVLNITLDELSAYDGKDGADAYIAYNGIIYDVTNNPNWPNGVHRGYINAGQDVTQLFQTAGASHDDSNITNLPIVGYLEDE